MKNKGAIIGLVIIAVSLAFGAYAFKGALVTYVTFTQAKQVSDATVQIMGKPIAGTMQYDTTAHALRFAMCDKSGQVMPVVFKGPKPEDLDSAMQKAVGITAQGTYDPKQGVFAADNLLVKCPSKYQGANANGERSYGAGT